MYNYHQTNLLGAAILPATARGQREVCFFDSLHSPSIHVNIHHFPPSEPPICGEFTAPGEYSPVSVLSERIPDQMLNS